MNLSKENYPVTCPFCRLKKTDVIWNFAGKIGCKSCADKHFEEGLKAYGKNGL